MTERDPPVRHPPMRDRRDVGQVVFLSEQMAAARELHSCCVGTEAGLAQNSNGIMRLLARLYGSPRRDGAAD